MEMPLVECEGLLYLSLLLALAAEESEMMISEPKELAIYPCKAISSALGQFFQQ